MGVLLNRKSVKRDEGYLSTVPYMLVFFFVVVFQFNGKKGFDIENFHKIILTTSKELQMKLSKTEFSQTSAKQTNAKCSTYNQALSCKK